MSFERKLERYKEAYSFLESNPQKTVEIIEECLEDADGIKGGHFYSLLASAYLSLDDNESALCAYDRGIKFLKDNGIENGLSKLIEERLYAMKSLMKVRVTKCYLVQLLDKDDNEVSCEYVFSDTKKEAEKRGKEMEDEYIKCK